MPHRPYPTLDVKCVTTIIDIARRGAVTAEIKEFAKCGYELGGAALGIMVGEPEDVIVGDSVTFVGEPAIVTQEQLQECHTALSAAQPELVTYGTTFGDTSSADDDVQKLSPAMAALLMQFALQALEFFLNRKKA